VKKTSLPYLYTALNRFGSLESDRFGLISKSPTAQSCMFPFLYLFYFCTPHNTAAPPLHAFFILFPVCLFSMHFIFIAFYITASHFYFILMHFYFFCTFILFFSFCISFLYCFKFIIIHIFILSHVFFLMHRFIMYLGPM